MQTYDLVLCRSADGWRLYPPRTTERAIAADDAPRILSAPGEPTQADYHVAAARLASR